MVLEKQSYLWYFPTPLYLNTLYVLDCLSKPINIQFVGVMLSDRVSNSCCTPIVTTNGKPKWYFPTRGLLMFIQETFETNDCYMFIHNVDLRKLKHLSMILQISSIFALNFWKLSSWYCSLQC